MNDYLDGINYQLAVITVFVLLLCVLQAFALLSIGKDNDRLRAENLKLNRHPSTVRSMPCNGSNTNVCVAEGCYGEACIHQPTLFDLEIDQALRLAAG
jgi:hypothetical protein